jgi:hypothetical protein
LPRRLRELGNIPSTSPPGNYHEGGRVVTETGIAVLIIGRRQIAPSRACANDLDQSAGCTIERNTRDLNLTAEMRGGGV